MTLFGRQAQQDLLVATPHSKVVLSTDWTAGPAHLLARLTRYGQYTESSNVASGDRTYGAKWIADLEAGYDISKTVTASVGAKQSVRRLS